MAHLSRQYCEIYCPRGDGFVKYINVLFLVFLVSCASAPTVKETEYGRMTLAEFDAENRANGYGFWTKEEAYGYRLLSWNKFLAMPNWALFDENDRLVQYLGKRGVPPKIEELPIVQAAKAKQLQLDRQEKAAEDAREAEAIKRDLLIWERRYEVASRPIACFGAENCRRMFALTQIFISENADVKIQLATDTIIETYGSDDGFAMKATKVPGASGQEQIDKATPLL